MEKKIWWTLLFCSFLTSTTYAADPVVGNNFDSVDLISVADFNSRTKEILQVANSEGGHEENIALINQRNGASSSAFAHIDQSAGSGNFAAIIQDASLHSQTALIFQSGSNGYAVIYQH